jgi:hypothetical protein
MNELIAKQVVKNKYWIVESDGSKVATIQAVDNGGYVYVSNENREKFNTIKLLTKVHNVKFSRETVQLFSKSTNGFVYEYPVTGKAYNVMWDIKHKFPVYTKTSKSKSFFCAGYYVVLLNDVWTESFCPKLISLNRYKFYGPYKTQKEMLEQLNFLESNGK